MAGSLGSLVVSLTAETAQFTSALSKASYTAEKNFKQISSFAKTAAGSLAALYGASSIVGFVKNQIDAADALNDMAERTGIAVDELSKLKYAAQLSDVEVGTLQQGIIKLSKAMVDTSNNTGSARNAFAALGISVKNTDGTLKTNSQVLNELSDGFSKYADGANKSALAIEIFGKSGAELIPLLNQGSDGLKAMGDELQILGGVITVEAARNAGIFNDNLDKLAVTGASFGRTIANQIMPYLNQLATEFLVAKANGLGFLDMLQMGLRSTDYQKQIESIDKSIKEINSSWDNPLFGSKDKRIERLEKQKKAIIDLQTILMKDQLMNPPKPRFEGTGQAPTPIDLGKAEKEAAEYAKGLARAGDANSKFANSISEMAAKNQQEISGVFMTDAQKKFADNMISINKQFLDSQSEITKQYEEGRLKLSDYNAQAAILAGNYEYSIEQAQQMRDKQEQLNSSWEYGASVALSRYIQESKNLAAVATGAVANGLNAMENSLTGIVTGTMSATQAFSNMVTSMIADIARLMIRQSVTVPLANMLSGALSFGSAGRAGGAAPVFDFSTPAPLATGTNYIPYDNFPALLHKGEAVIPAKYNNNANGNTNVVVNNYSTSQASTKEVVDSRGNRRIEVTIGDIVSGELARSGSNMNNTLKTSFGARQNLVGR
jgi:hypothetical protein